MKPNKNRSPLKSGKPKKRKVAVVVQNKTMVNKAVQEELLRFTEYHPVRRFSKNLRTLLIEFLMYDGATEASYLQDLLYDLQGLFELFEVIQSESDD